MTKYVASIWTPGPIRNEVHRLAKEHLTKHYNGLGKRFDLLTPTQQNNAVTVLLWNAQEYWFRLAKLSMEDKS